VSGKGGNIQTQDCVPNKGGNMSGKGNGGQQGRGQQGRNQQGNRA
jgi:hypothetical protein